MRRHFIHIHVVLHINYVLKIIDLQFLHKLS